MKRFSEKTRRLTRAPLKDRGGAASSKDYFAGWLDSVAPQISNTHSSVTRRPLGFKHSITAHDMVRVNRATVRESTSHRHWPPDVVAQFLSAEVITRKNKQR